MTKIIYPKAWIKSGEVSIVIEGVSFQKHKRSTVRGFEYNYNIDFIAGYQRAISDIKKLNKKKKIE